MHDNVEKTSYKFAFYYTQILHLFYSSIVSWNCNSFVVPFRRSVSSRGSFGD